MIGAGVRDSCGKSASKGDPAVAMAPRADRPGKRVPYVPIGGQFLKT
ncbi:hypothetical protein ACQKOM_14880 [Peribacillus frigoritolerans]